jgi:hypothetical protein
MAEELALVITELIVPEADKLSNKHYSNPSQINHNIGARDPSSAGVSAPQSQVQPQALAVKSDVKCFGCRCSGPGIWKARARGLFILSTFGMMMSATLIHAQNSFCSASSSGSSESNGVYAYAGIIIPIVLFCFFEVNPWPSRVSTIHAHRGLELHLCCRYSLST